MLARVLIVAMVGGTVAACSGSAPGLGDASPGDLLSPGSTREDMRMPASDMAGAPDGRDGGGAGDDEPWYCVSDGGTVTTQGDGSFSVTTEHYALSLEVPTADRANELGHIAEAAWMAFADYFKGAPTLGNGDHLKVKWLDTQAAWMKALTDDGVTPPAAGGIYWTGTKTAYMYRQPTTYFSTTLFIHEMTHQFHFLARTGNTGRPSWYIEGMAEYLSRHDWDGRCLRLGRMPMLTQEDYPQQALATVMQSGIDLPTIVSTGSMQPRPIDLAIYRYMERGDAGIHRAGFTAFRKTMDDGTQDPLAALKMSVGDPMVLEGRIVDTLPDEQEPMSVVFLEWTHIKPGMVRGSSPFVSVARAKASAPKRFDVTMLTTGGNFSGGVLATYDDTNNFSAYLASNDNHVSVFRYTRGMGVFYTLKAIAAPADGRYAWTVMPSDKGTVVTVNGVSLTEPVGMKTAGGVAVSGSTLDFDQISWQ